MKKVIQYFVVLFLIIFSSYQSYLLIKGDRKKDDFYEYLILNRARITFNGIKNKDGEVITRNTIDSILKGAKLIVTISPNDCPYCLNEEVKFLKLITKYIPSELIILILNTFPNKEVIEPWLKDMGIYYKYYFDPDNTIEEINNLERQSPWNIILKDGNVLGCFSYINIREDKMKTKIIIRIIKKVIRQL